MLIQNEKPDVTMRTGRLGSSDAAAILGIPGAFSTPVQVYMAAIGEGSPREATLRMELGSDFEGAIMERYSRLTGNTVGLHGEACHPQYPFIVDHPDGVVHPDGPVVEAKFCGTDQCDSWGEDGSDEVPPIYRAQGIVHMACWDRGSCEYPVLFGNRDWRILRLERDPMAEDRVVSAMARFFENHVAKRIPPDPTTRSDATLLWPKETEGQLVVANAEIMDLLHGLGNLETEAKEYQVAVDAAKTKLAAYLGLATAIVDENGVPLVTHKSQTRKGYEVKPWEGRVLRITKAGKAITGGNDE